MRKKKSATPIREQARQSPSSQGKESRLSTPLEVGGGTGAVASKRLATIDLGSNSIRLLVAEVFADGSYTILDDEKQTTRLAKGINPNNVSCSPTA